MSQSNSKVSFWKIFAACLVAGVTMIIIFFLFFSSFLGALIKPQATFDVQKNTVLHLTLDGSIKEISNQTVDPYQFKVSSEIGLSDLLYGFEIAAKDNNVKGIFIELNGANCGFATASLLRKAIKQFEEKSGKFVIAYHKGEVVSLKEYYIASSATKNYGFPTSTFEFLGLGVELMFYKGLFDKLDLEMQVVRGKNNDFKSAVEPYFLTEMSDSSRLQMQTLLNNIWGEMSSQISNDRGISLTQLNEIANNGKVRRIEEAVKSGFIDNALYRDEVLHIIGDSIGVKKNIDIPFKSFEKYARAKFISNQNVANVKNANVAVIVAQGGITTDGDGIASNSLVELINEAANDKSIKSIVFRVNSPGGSALASEEIWHAVKNATKKKEVIVSMGDLAASGGYYIATPATKVFAQKNTITGSIGVFGVIPYTGEMLSENLGISFDRVSTNPHAIFSLNKRLSPMEFSIVQQEVNEIYSLFLKRVADGRGMTTQEVNKVARGRVWTGGDALRLGLVDTLGGFRDAINYAIETAEIVDPVIRYYPKVEEDPLMKLVESFENQKIQIKEGMEVPEEMVEMYQHIKEIEDYTGIQARWPYKLNW